MAVTLKSSSVPVPMTLVVNLIFCIPEYCNNGIRNITTHYITQLNAKATKYKTDAQSTLWALHSSADR